MVKLHYFYDPLCGWCYGSTALVGVAADAESIELIFHPGGMVSRQAINSSFKSHILDADEAIARNTGAVFGERYKARLIGAEDLIFDSYLATRAILVAKEMGVDEGKMLKAIQDAHYQQGLAVEELRTLADIGASFGLDILQWHKSMKLWEDAVIREIHTSQELMGVYQVQGFPAFVAETASGSQHLPHAQYYQQVDVWGELLAGLV